MRQDMRHDSGKEYGEDTEEVDGSTVGRKALVSIDVPLCMTPPRSAGGPVFSQRPWGGRAAVAGPGGETDDGESKRGLVSYPRVS